MRAIDLVSSPREGAELQLEINEFLDDFRRGDDSARRAMIADEPDVNSGKREGLIAAIVSALCREVALDPPEWVARTSSPEPYFVVPAKGYELRVRLMLEAPAPFKIRNVFVPENYLSRA